MSSRMNIKNEELLKPGSYSAVLQSIEQKETQYGERLLWLFYVPEEGAEVAGFTSLSSSRQAHAFLWATALNSEIADKHAWGTEDVEGRKCPLVVGIYEDAKGESHGYDGVRINHRPSVLRGEIGGASRSLRPRFYRRRI
jgi:hypothetical protein